MTLQVEYRLEKYDCKHKTELVCQAEIQFRTHFKNNVVVHMYNRVLRYFQHKLEATLPPDAGPPQRHLAEVDLGLIMNKLFRESNAELNERCDSLLTEFRRTLNLGTLSLKETEVKREWWRYIHFLHSLQKWLHENGEKSFMLVPISDFGMKHAVFDRTAFKQLLCKLRYPEAYKVKTDDIIAIEKQMFNLQRYIRREEKKNGRFTGTISTNTVDVSIHFERDVRSPRTNESRIQEIQENPDAYKTYVGVDPGRKVMYGAVRTDGNTYENLLLTNGQFRELTKDSRRWHQHQKIINHPDYVRFQRDAAQVTQKSREYVAYTRCYLSHLKNVRRLRSVRKVTWMKWEKKRLTRSALDKQSRIISKPITAGTRSVVAIGNATISPTLRRHRFVPNKGLNTALLRNAKNNHSIVVFIDESYTSQTCSICHHRGCFQLSELPDRFAFCKNCKKVWHRDINAGNNILQKARSMINRRPIKPRAGINFKNRTHPQRQRQPPPRRQPRGRLRRNLQNRQEQPQPQAERQPRIRLRDLRNILIPRRVRRLIQRERQSQQRPQVQRPRRRARRQVRRERQQEQRAQPELRQPPHRNSRRHRQPRPRCRERQPERQPRTASQIRSVMSRRLEQQTSRHQELIMERLLRQRRNPKRGRRAPNTRQAFSPRVERLVQHHQEHRLQRRQQRHQLQQEEPQQQLQQEEPQQQLQQGPQVQRARRRRRLRPRVRPQQAQQQQQQPQQ